MPQSPDFTDKHSSGTLWPRVQRLTESVEWAKWYSDLRTADRRLLALSPSGIQYRPIYRIAERANQQHLEQHDRIWTPGCHLEIIVIPLLIKLLAVIEYDMTRWVWIFVLVLLHLLFRLRIVSRY